MTAVSKIIKEASRSPIIKNNINRATAVVSDALSSLITNEAKQSEKDKQENKTIIQPVDSKKFKEYLDESFRQKMAKLMEEKKSQTSFTDKYNVKENKTEQPNSFTDKLSNQANDGNKSSRSL